MNGHVETTLCPACRRPSPLRTQTRPWCNYRFVPLAMAAQSHWSGSPWTVVASAALALLTLLPCAALFLANFMSFQVAATSPYQEALRITQESSEVQNVLGDRIKMSSPAFGIASRKYGSQFVEWRVVLSGSRTSGNLYGVTNEVNGNWEFSRLMPISSIRGNKIDLSPKSQRLSLPPTSGSNLPHSFEKIGGAPSLRFRHPRSFGYNRASWFGCFAFSSTAHPRFTPRSGHVLKFNEVHG
jgi:Cytochrome oxidase complex assembly protein 1